MRIERREWTIEGNKILKDESIFEHSFTKRWCGLLKSNRSTILFTINPFKTYIFPIFTYRFSNTLWFQHSDRHLIKWEKPQKGTIIYSIKRHWFLNFSAKERRHLLIVRRNNIMSFSFGEKPNQNKVMKISPRHHLFHTVCEWSQHHFLSAHVLFNEDYCNRLSQVIHYSFSLVRFVSEMFANLLRIRRSNE